MTNEPKLGRPSDFTQTIADIICERMSDGESLRAICSDKGMPNKATVFRWLAKDEVFRDQYAHARDEQAETLFDEILDIADDGRNDWMLKRGDEDDSPGWRENGESLNRSKIRIDARKWMAGKLKPKKYGEKQIIGGDPDNPLHTITRIELVAPGHDNSED